MNDLIKGDLSYLNKLNSLADDSNTIFEENYEKKKVLKINYEEKLPIPRGAWVLGQKIEDGKVVEPGVQVKSIIILKVLYKYYYRNGDVVCQSRYFKMGEKVEGNRFKFDCRYCKYRKIEGDDRCICQVVAFGYAIVDKKLEEFVMYLKGTSYMPFIDYLKASCKETIEDNGVIKEFNIPYFSFITNLGSIEKKNRSVSYYVADFKKGKLLNEKDINIMIEKIKDIEVYVSMLNEKIMSIDFEDVDNKTKDDKFIVYDNKKSKDSKSSFKKEIEEDYESGIEEDYVDDGDDVEFNIPF